MSPPAYAAVALLQKRVEPRRRLRFNYQARSLTSHLAGTRRQTNYAPNNRTGETEVQAKFLHLFGDFSQPAIQRHMSGNSADISKRYFQNRTASSSSL